MIDKPLKKLAIISALSLLTGCDLATQSTAQPMARAEYLGISTNLLVNDLVNFHVAMRNVSDAEAVEDYAECAAAQYALIRGYGFARHVRTNVAEQGGVWRADAVYTISPSLPRGLKTIDAEVVAAHCAENGIPMV